MSPPKLTAYAPVTDIVEPVIIGFCPCFRQNFNFGRYGGSCFGGEFRRRHEPLHGNIGFDNGFAAIAGADAVVQFLDFDKLPEGFDILDDAFTAFFTAESFVNAGFLVHISVVVNDLDKFDAVRMSQVPVVGVVARRDFQRSRSEFLVDITVGNNGHGAVHNGHNDFFADKMLVAFIVGVHANGGVSEYGFRTGCGDDNGAGAVLKHIFHMPQCAFLGGVFNFVIS